MLKLPKYVITREVALQSRGTAMTMTATSVGSQTGVAMIVVATEFNQTTYHALSLSIIWEIL